MRRPSLFGGKGAETAPDERASPEPASKPAASKERSESRSLEQPKQASRSEPRATIRYLDRADMAETFADSIAGLAFDGQTLRIEFGVTRLENLQANAPISGRRYPACRLVLPHTAAVDLINRMQQIATALRQAGVVKPAQSSDPALHRDER